MSQTMGFVSTYLAAPFTLECGAQPQSPPQLSPLFPLSDPWSHCSPGSRMPFPIRMLVCSQIGFGRFHHPMNLAKERMSRTHTTLVCNGCAVRWARIAGCSIEFPSIVARFSICVVDDSVAAISAKERVSEHFSGFWERYLPELALPWTTRAICTI